MFTLYTQINGHVEPHRLKYMVIFFVFIIVDLIYNVYTGQMSIPLVCKLLCLHDFLISAENLLPVLRWTELLQGAVKGLQFFPHLAQRVLDLAGLIQNLHAAGKGVVANCKGPLDGCGVSPGERSMSVNSCMDTDRWHKTQL